jgi:uncharacterized protein
MYQLILIPIIVGFLSQAFKLIIDGIPNNLNWQHMINDYGGMPSSHSAFISSVATVIGLHQGFDSAAFAVVFALAIVVIRDAVGFRREIGRNNRFTNMIAKSAVKNKKMEYLTERVGHSIPEVACGLIFGVSLSIILYLTLIIVAY